MTVERYDYCRNMGYDVLAVTELWRKQDKFTNRTNEFTVSATVKDKFGNLVNENDPAAGVGILLSPRAQKKFMGAGNNNSERICWVRLRGPVCNLFIIAVYMPHNSRVQPAQEDTLKELDTICKQAKQGDCVVVLGDFNVQLPANVQGSTGKHVCAQGESEEANAVLGFMKSHDLFAVNTKFRKRQSPATYLHVVAQGTAGVHDQYLGRDVKVHWKGKDVHGKIIENFGDEYGIRKWKAKFDDGYVKSYLESELDSILVLRKRETVGKQLDYIVVSNRWLTCIEDASVKWGPSEHRNIYGRADHALVCCKWIWKIQSSNPVPCKDFGVLRSNTTEGVLCIAKFNEAVEAKEKELSEALQNPTIEQQYANLCEAISHAIESTLPSKKRGKTPARKVSKRTRDLFDKRTEMGKHSGAKWTKTEYKKIQKQIKQSSLQDHAEWVSECAEEMAAANSVGDTRKLYDLVKKLSGKVDKTPAVDLQVNKQGAPISCAKERAAAWFNFLQKKFSATPAEQGRPAMPTLPERSANNILTVTEVLKAVKSLKNHKAVGADGIPVEVYKSSPAAFNLLYKLLARIWTEEIMPKDMGVAIFKMI